MIVKKFENEFDTSENISEKSLSPTKLETAETILKPKTKIIVNTSGSNIFKIKTNIAVTPIAFLMRTEQLRTKSKPSET